METSLLIARILGPIMVVLAVSLLVNAKTFQSMIEEFINNLPIRYLRGFMVLLLGLLMVQFHNIWTVSWTLILTILGWLWVIGGAFALIFPTTGNRVMMRYVSNSTLITVHASLILALGLFLSYMGYRG